MVRRVQCVIAGSCLEAGASFSPAQFSLERHSEANDQDYFRRPASWIDPFEFIKQHQLNQVSRPINTIVRTRSQSTC